MTDTESWWGKVFASRESFEAWLRGEYPDQPARPALKPSRKEGEEAENATT